MPIKAPLKLENIMTLSKKLFQGTRERYARANTEYQAKIEGDKWIDRVSDRLYQRAAWRVMERCVKAQHYLNVRNLRDRGVRLATW